MGGPPCSSIYGELPNSKPETGRVVAERLIRDGRTLLIGTNDSRILITVAQAAEAAEISFPTQYRLCAANHREDFILDLPKLPSGDAAGSATLSFALVTLGSDDRR